MMSQETATLLRIEEKLDHMSEKLTTVITKEQAHEKSLEQARADLDMLKAAYYKALGIVAFLTTPGIASLLWLGLHAIKKP